ncbi:50S ribosomal protein L31e [Candidatus Woesearchaeota archaeon]|nr:50S ribosomal protein L31e [Candidatus Woesearchaeota archaeon]
MAKLERVYNVPLRREWLKVPRYNRAKKASKALKEFLVKHMKAAPENIKIGKFANQEVWKHGMKNPPHHIKINVVKDDEGKVFAELVGAPVEVKEEKKGKETKKQDTEREKKKEEIKKRLEEAKKKKEEEKKQKQKEAKPEEKPMTKEEAKEPKSELEAASEEPKPAEQPAENK